MEIALRECVNNSNLVEQYMNKPIIIDNQEAITKLIAFIVAKAKARFNIDPEVMEEIMFTLWRYAKDNGITIQIIDPSNKRIAYLGGGGVVVGAAIGYAVGSIPGAVVGSVVGGLAGCALAHITLKMEPPVIGQAQAVTLDLI